MWFCLFIPSEIVNNSKLHVIDFLMFFPFKKDIQTQETKIPAADRSNLSIWGVLINFLHNYLGWKLCLVNV